MEVPAQKKRRFLSAAFLIITIGIIIYSNALGGDFIWDDAGFVVRNDFIKDLKLFPAYFTSKEALARGGLGGENYRPLLVLSYAFDYSFWKLNPLGYHAVNVSFHILNALLVFSLILLLTRRRAAALLAALFFLAHPIQTESVSWISGRADVLFLFFYLASLIAYIRYTQRKGIVLYLASLLLFAFSLLSKEMAASLPFIIVLYDLLYGGKERLSVKAIRYFPFFLTLESYVILRFNVIGKLAQTGYWTGDFYTTMLTMARGIVYYIRLLVYPVGQSADYITFPLSRSIKEPAAALSIIVLAGLFLAAIKLAKKHKLLSFSILWFFITLAPVTNIIPVKIPIAERFLYLPSISFCLILSLFLASLFRRHALIYAAFFVVSVYSSLTLIRNESWADEFAFFGKILERYPDNDRARLNLSALHYNKSDMDRSYEEAKKALKSAPEEYPAARGLMALHHLQNDRLDEAAGEFRKILKAKPRSIKAYTGLAIVHMRKKEYGLAYDEYRKALALNPGSLTTRINIVTFYLAKGDMATGIKSLQEILKEAPSPNERTVYAAAHLRLGELYALSGDKERAFRSWQRVYEDFAGQVWFYEISRFLTGKIDGKELLLQTRSWQPEFKIISYYYLGVKKEIDGDAGGAEICYDKVLGTPSQKYNEIKILAAKRLEELGAPR